jgi:hypothetical protein
MSSKIQITYSSGAILSTNKMPTLASSNTAYLRLENFRDVETSLFRKSIKPNNRVYIALNNAELRLP